MSSHRLSRPPTTKEQIARKYDDEATGYSERFVDQEGIAERYTWLVAQWGGHLPRGAQVLEIGCANGFVTECLVRAGYRVTACDISFKMVQAARRRLERAGLTADFLVCDVDALSIEGTFEATIALMRTFFRFTENPQTTLSRLSSITATKLLVDLNPRHQDLQAAIDTMGRVGFGEPSWRPLFVPQNVRVPNQLRPAVRMAETIPGLRSLAMRYKFNVVVKGERAPDRASP